jgi:ABC-type branched-subunit amino acid transport system ATPase component
VTSTSGADGVATTAVRDSALTLVDVHGYYGKSHVLQGVNLDVPHAAVVSLLGRNGVGKTTTLRAVLNLLPRKSGHVTVAGTDVSRWSTDAIARHGVSYMPQEAKIFPDLTVRENIEIAASTMPGRRPLDEVLEDLPALRPKLTQLAGTLSGGQQQMVAIARSLVMSSPLVLMDEPSDGLMPKLVQELGGLIRLLASKGMAILLVEQNLELALAVSQRIYVMEKGQIRVHTDPDAVRRDQSDVYKYLGVS